MRLGVIKRRSVPWDSSRMGWILRTEPTSKEYLNFFLLTFDTKKLDLCLMRERKLSMGLLVRIRFIQQLNQTRTPLPKQPTKLSTQSSRILLMFMPNFTDNNLIIMSEQIPHSKQLFALAVKISKDSHNITAFKRRKSLQNKSTHKLLQHTLPTEASKSQAKDSHQTIFPHKSADKTLYVAERYTMRLGPHKRKKSHVTDYNQTGYTQNFITRRNTNNPREPNNKQEERTDPSGVGGISKDKLVNSQRAMTNDVSLDKQRKMSKKNGTLGDAHLENWINQCLIERCPEQKYDKSIVNAAIKRFQVDKNSLLSYGVSQTNISRILKGLYVYSNGFNNLLTELGSHSIPLKRNIWRVFSLLVEHCSQGTIETVVSYMQKQAQKEQEGLKKEIERQQGMIENHQSLNRELNQKIYKENNDLRHQMELLELDRAVLKQNNEEHERAFAEQVSLRLMFESKISDLHRLYRELQLKHHKLFSDFQIKLNDITYLKDKAAYYHQQNVKLRKDIGGLQSDLCQKDYQVKKLTGIVSRLTQEVNEHFKGEVQRKIDQKAVDNNIRQREIKDKQQQGRLKTVQASLFISQRTHQSLIQEYHRALDQNKRLIHRLDSELAEISKRLRLHKEQNNNNAHFLSQMHALTLKLQQKLQALAEMEIFARRNLQKIDELQLQLQSSTALTQSLKSDLAAERETISNLKRVNTELDQTLAQALKSNQYLQKTTKELSKNLQIQRDAVFHWKKKYQAAQFQLQRISTQHKILKEEIPKLQTKVQNSKVEGEQNVKAQKERMSNMVTELNKNRLLAEKAREAYNMAQEKLRDERFQRGNLDYKYKHSLTVIENLQDVVKNQNSKIAELQRSNDELGLGLKLAKGEYARLEEKTNIERRNFQQKVKDLQYKLRAKHAHAHPMIVEDLLQHMHRMQDQQDEFKQKFALWKEQYQQKKFYYEQRLNRMEQQNKTAQRQYHQQLRRKDLEIQYEHSKRKDYTQRIEYLQLTLNAKARFQETDPPPETYKEKQRRYLQIISENYFKINSLVADLEALEDHNQDLVARVQSTEKELNKRQEIISTVQKEKEELKGANQELAGQMQKFQTVRKQLQQEINDRQSLLNSYVPEYKSLRQSPSQRLKKSRELSPNRRDNNSGQRKVSLMEPIIVQIKEREQESKEGKEPQKITVSLLAKTEEGIPLKKKGSQRSSFDKEEWRADFSSKLRSTFGYYQ